MKCKKCGKENNIKESKPVYWKKNDKGLKYPWNKEGEIKSYILKCKYCGYENEWMPL